MTIAATKNDVLSRLREHEHRLRPLGVDYSSSILAASVPSSS